MRKVVIAFITSKKTIKEVEDKECRIKTIKEKNK